MDPALLLGAFNESRGLGFHEAPGLCESVSIFTRFPSDLVLPVSESRRTSIRRIELPGQSQFLLVVAHLPSKLHWSQESQALECTEIARQILAEEDKAGHQRTVLVGDFNMNPFESGMVGAAGFHSVMSRHVASRAARTVQGREYRFFYNPMWSHYGDARSPTAGSYFYDSAEQVNYFWNMFDQVLIRPELADRFDPTKLKIVTSLGSSSLVVEGGRPDQAEFSDHLPLAFELDF